MRASAQAIDMPARDRAIVAGLIDALPEAAIVIDQNDRVIALNAPARALFPALRPDLLLARGLRAPDVFDCLARARASGHQERATWLERVPVERFLELHVAAWDWQSGAQSMILSLRDLSESRRVERMRVDFVANASHELRTPLASLLGFVETLQGPAREDAAAREKFLKIMGEQARRMTRLVDDLLSLSRIEQHLHLLPQSPVDMAAIVRHIADTLTPLAQDSEVEFTVETAGVIVPGDRDELLRVVENLVENAIKYGASEAPEGQRKVEISLVAQERQCVLSVRDFGAGIAPEHLPRLTERFYRVDAGASRAKGGTGLGLAIVKHIVARHRGRLAIDSHPGQGTTCVVTLPLQPPPRNRAG
ncbi:two-component sensor histidine kinase [Methylocella silvestris]|uniref:histidine kinase n=2 Tax=Methylocella silvestris TaxID=199596 RepID=A0A2J7TFQ3_METSI|nr:two-component sensor histidine kinase [Methylocella silvestris]